MPTQELSMTDHAPWLAVAPIVLVGGIIFLRYNRQKRFGQSGQVDTPAPSVVYGFDLNNPRAILRIDDIIGAVSMALQSLPHGTMWSSADDLGVPRDEAEQALLALLAIAEDRAHSQLIAKQWKGEACANIARDSIQGLARFLPIPAADLPYDDVDRNIEAGRR